MQVSYDRATHELTRALAARGFAAAAPQLLSIEPPRAWGLTTNVCFLLGKQAAEGAIAEKTTGLDKKAAKQVASQLARAAGEQLADDIAAELNQLVGGTGDVPGGTGGAPVIGADGQTDETPGGALPFIERVEAEGAYINFYYDTQVLAAHVTAQVLRDGPAYGKGAPQGRRIMVEYAQPNTHKDFHVGHLRNASIGQAIANLLEHDGNDLLKATYIGDVGKHVATAIWGDSIKFDHDRVVSRGFFTELPDRRADPLSYWGYCYKECGRWLAYKVAHGVSSEEVITWVDATREQSEVHRSNKWTDEQRIQLWLKNWEEGEQFARQQWAESRAECDSSFKKIFNELQVDFDEDYYFYESTVDDTKLGQKTAAELKERGIAVVDESEEYKGALYVDFEKQADAVRDGGQAGHPTPVFTDEEKKRVRRLGKMTILRSDGTSLYQTKELGLAKHKFDLVLAKYGEPLAESLYVVGAEQKLYFEQVFAILKLWGFPNADHCRHISYELVVLPEGKMSSREGNIVSYRELKDEAIKRARDVAREKGIGAADESGAINEQKLEQIARDVAIAAIKFAMLQVTGSQQIVFDFESALSFSGRAAPYLQYAYARAGKLTAGAAGQDVPADPGYTLHDSEVELARLIATFPATCRTAAGAYEPATLCTYLYSLANAFSAFYRDCRVLDAEEPMRSFRVSLTRAFRQVLATGFAVLALPLPEEM